MDHLAVDVGQSKVATGVTVGQLLVIDAEQVEHRGVEVVGVYGVVTGQDAVFIGLTVHDATLDAPAGHPG